MSYLDNFLKGIDIEIQNKRIKDIFLVFVVGMIASFMATLMIYVVLAQLFLTSIIGNIPQKYYLSFITIGLFFISLLSSIIVSIIIIDNIKRRSLIASSLISFILTLGVIISLSYISLLYAYPSVFNNLVGIDYFIVFPLTIIYFAYYVLDSFIYLYIITIVIYYVFFSITLYFLYQEREV